MKKTHIAPFADHKGHTHGHTSKQEADQDVSGRDQTGDLARVKRT